MAVQPTAPSVGSDPSRLVTRADIVDYATYDDHRASTRPLALEAKRRRRFEFGRFLTFCFENRDTLVYQIQEIMRVEHIVRVSDIDREIQAYNRLLGEPGDLGCVLMIGVEDSTLRDRLLSDWCRSRLPQRLFVRLDDGRCINAVVDDAQVGADRLSAVQYLRFPVGGRVPVSLGVAMPGGVPPDRTDHTADTRRRQADGGESLLPSEVHLPRDLRAALAHDLQTDLHSDVHTMP